MLRFKFRGKPISRNSQLYFESMDMNLTMETSKLYLNFDNLFNGDKFLCEQTNNLLNRRSEDVFRELKKRIENSFAEEIAERVNGAFGNFPYSEYFLPGPVPKLKVTPETRDIPAAKSDTPKAQPEEAGRSAASGDTTSADTKE